MDLKEHKRYERQGQKKKGLLWEPLLKEVCSYYLFFLAIAFSAAATMFSFVSPYLFSNCLGVPLSPNVSITATYSCGAGQAREATLAMLSPRPPFICALQR